MVEIGEYDYKGQPKYKIRKVIADGEILSTMPTSVYRVDWVPSGTSCLYESTMLEGSYRTDMQYDALGRPVSIELPMDVNSSRKLVTPTYNRAGAMTAIMLDSDTYVSRIAYNAKGQKILSVLGCGLMTRHAGACPEHREPGQFQVVETEDRGIHFVLAYLYAEFGDHQTRLRLHVRPCWKHRGDGGQDDRMCCGRYQCN